MKLKFTISYRTEWGQQLVVCIKYHHTDGTERTSQLPMLTQDGDHWSAETAVVESRRSPIQTFTYYYIVADANGQELRREWSLVPRTYDFDPSKTYIMPDQWRDTPLPYHLYSLAYEATLGPSTHHLPPSPPNVPLFRKTIIFRVSAPQVGSHQQLAVLGSHPALGSWNPARYLPMSYQGGRDWIVSVNADGLQLPLEYKYVVIDTETHQLLQWEEGDNRVVDEPLLQGQGAADGEVLVLYGCPLRLAERPWRCAGVTIPVGALRSEHSCGVGDFGDLLRFVDWAAATGMKAIQLLPVNDTTCQHTWADCHPYNITSAFALHPHYIDLEQLPPLKDKQQLTAFRRQQRELNAQPQSDYEAVDRVKWDYLRRVFAEQGADTLASPQYQQWREANEEWLTPYAEWCCGEQKDEMPLHCYVQYHLHLQLKAAAQHAHEKGIFLKGDLPIGVSAHSSETSQHPAFFNHDACTGTPPDAFSAKGQNWGFPTYNWQQPEGQPSIYDWFRRRLRHQEQYFDALRIDHILGFFRIWEIPACQVQGIMGHFAPALPFTQGEIEQFGLPFRKDFLTRPFINDRIIERIFGIHAQYVRDTFLVRKAYGLFDLKEEVQTQQLVLRHFEGRTDENSLWIRDGLLQVVANVLLLEDARHPGMYHPRIDVWKEPVFEALSADERDAFMRLYNNYYLSRHAMFWGKTGYDRLSTILRHTQLLVCAEDLGQLPDCVPPVLDALRILTLELQQMPKQSGLDYAHLDGNPVRSVATTSTHDMAPLRLWWQDNQDRAQHFYATMLQKQGMAPEQLPAHIAEEIIARHLYSPSMLCILPLQDWLAMDGELRHKNPREERINHPANPYNRWNYRMHLSIEQLLKEDRFNAKLKTMITRSKR